MHLHNSDVQASSFQASGGLEIWVVQNLLRAGGQEGIYVLTGTNLDIKPFQAYNFLFILGFERVGLGKICFGWAG